MLFFGHLFLFFIGIQGFAHCMLNMFLDVPEVNRLLGIGAKYEMFYIRNGTVLRNALKFPLTVPSTSDRAFFTWQNLNNSSTISYMKDVVISQENTIRMVRFNISDNGFVPLEQETVAIEIVCNGFHSTETIVNIRFNFTVDDDFDNISSVIFHRKKDCHRDDETLSRKTELQESNKLEETLDTGQLKIFYFVLSIGCSLITTIIICILAYHFSKEKSSNRNRLRAQQQMRSRVGEPENTPFVVGRSTIANSGTSTSSNVSHASLHRSKKYVPVDNFSDLHERVMKINVERKRVRLQKVELEGTFGRVFYGTYTREDGTENSVLVKTVMDFASPMQVSSLLKEGTVMYGLRHHNILSIFGVSIEDQKEPFVIYMRDGYSNLKKFLQKCKVSSEGVAHTLTTQDVVQIAMQIVIAIQYMHKKQLLHKDIATRNCLIDPDTLHVKVADNALSRDLFPNDYHCLGDNENRPIKWLAFESLVHKTFSTSSDVWSFGVTLWELTTLAQQPYAEIDPFEIEHYLKDGYRLSQPINCPDELFAVMAYCWAMSPNERPTFPRLFNYLQGFNNQLNKYV